MAKYVYANAQIQNIIRNHPMNVTASSYTFTVRAQMNSFFASFAEKNGLTEGEMLQLIDRVWLENPYSLEAGYEKLRYGRNDLMRDAMNQLLKASRNASVLSTQEFDLGHF